jgi:LysM repeat protein
MKWKATGTADDAHKELSESDFEEDGYSPLRQNRFGEITKELLRKSWIIAGFVILLLFLVVVFFRPGSKETGSEKARFNLIETRMTRIEERLTGLDGSLERLENLEKIEQRMLLLTSRLDKFEATVSKKIAAVSKKTDSISKKTASITSKPATVKAPAVSAVKKTSGSHHTVVKGDTLYSISRDFKISVVELMKINGLPKGTSIYPGQKLKLTP